jgi:ligand-binding sensor domain-containing protein/surface antigen
MKKFYFLLALLLFIANVSYTQWSPADLTNPAYTTGPYAESSLKLVGQCTWFVYGRIQETGLIPKAVLEQATNRNGRRGIFLGNANTWHLDAQSAGLATGTIPYPGAIAVWYTNNQNHIAFVEKTSPLMVTESNSYPTVGYNVVIAIDSTELRQSYSQSSSVLWKMPRFTVMRVDSGPISNENYQWFKLSGNGREGWSAWLEADASGPAKQNSFWWNFTRIHLSATTPLSKSSPDVYIYPHPQPISPTDGATDVPLTVTFQWKAVGGATYRGATYRLEVSRNSSFTDLVVDISLSSNTYTAQLSPNTKYWWRVHIGSNKSSGWPGWSFTTTTTLTPTLSVNPTSLDFGNVPVGTSSNPLSYTITGSNLTSDVVINAPSGFEISTSSGGPYGSSLTLTPSSGSIGTTIYVRFSPISVRSYSGDITNQSSGITKYVSVTGIGIQPTFSQEWIVFTSGRYIQCLIEEGEYLWVGTDGGGLVRLNKSTGEFIVYDKWNSKLPNNDVLAIAIDGEGNKWIGTAGGLAKFDGVNWTVYNTSNSGLPYDWVYSIAIDGQGNKWIGTYGGGLAKFDGVNWIVYSTSNSGLPDNRIWTIAIDEQGNKWIGTSGGLAKFDGVNWTVYNTSNSGLPNNYVYKVVIDRYGDKWVGTWGGGLAKFDGVNWTVYKTSNSGLPSNTVYAIAIDGQGNKWIGTAGGLAKFDGVNWTVYKTSNSGLPSNTVYAIATDGQGNKWIGTAGGLAKFDGVNWTVYNTSNSGLPGNNVSAIVINALKDKWIGTDGGLAKFDGVNWTVYNTSNSGLPYDWVYAIAIDGQGNKWIGTNGGGLAKFDGTSWTVYNTSNSGLPSNWVYSIAIDGQGNKWIGNWFGGLTKFDDVSWTVYNTSNSGLPNNYVYKVVIDRYGDKWVGTWGGGLAKFDGVNWTVYNTSNSGLLSNYVLSIAIDGQGNKWIGTRGGGLAKFDGVNWVVYNTLNSGLPSNWVSVITMDDQGNKWVGTWGGGLAKFDGINWTVYNTSNSGLPDDWIDAITIDSQGNKWIGTRGGGLAVYREGGVILPVEVKEKSNEIPTNFALYQNYPNPFNPSTTIEFDIPERTNVKLIVYDILGREVETLIDKELEPGKYKINYTATNLPSGVYFYTLRTPKFTKTNKMLLIK